MCRVPQCPTNCRSYAAAACWQNSSTYSARGFPAPVQADFVHTCLSTSTCWCCDHGWSQLHTQGELNPVQEHAAFLQAWLVGSCSVCLCLQRHRRICNRWRSQEGYAAVNSSCCGWTLALPDSAMHRSVKSHTLCHRQVMLVIAWRAG
jgi:hypothetical protein